MEFVVQIDGGLAMSQRQWACGNDLMARSKWQSAHGKEKMAMSKWQGANENKQMTGNKWTWASYNEYEVKWGWVCHILWSSMQEIYELISINVSDQWWLWLGEESSWPCCYSRNDQSSNQSSTLSSSAQMAASLSLTIGPISVRSHSGQGPGRQGHCRQTFYSPEWTVAGLCRTAVQMCQPVV